MDGPYNIHILNYNYYPKLILEELSRQIADRPEKLRIHLWDDGSDDFYRNQLSRIRSDDSNNKIIWKFQTENHGRSAIRQKIINSGQEGWTVSIDSDMMPDPSFIDQMINSLQDPKIIYTGVHYYQKQPPKKDFLLHWLYGRKRELPAGEKNPYMHFSTGIFAVHTKTARNLSFDDRITGYGHEDTLFGLQLRKKRIPIKRTNMMAVHQGLTSNIEFIERQKEAIRNLKVLLSKHPEYQNQLIKWGNRINHIPGVNQYLKKDAVHHFCRSRLLQSPQQLFYLDLIKLSVYLKEFG